MNVLFLGITPSPLTSILEQFGCRVVECANPIDVEYLRAECVDFAASYRYRHIVRKPVIEYLKEKIINLHISLLPWNRGADPNLWSFLADTPKGVTIHYINEGVDTGDIIAQKEIVFDTAGETLATTYDRLNREMIELFKEQWPLIMRGETSRWKQPPGGSFHRLKDNEPFKDLLSEKGWDTPVAELIGKALINSGKQASGR